MGDYTLKMNLATWDQLLDRYDYQQLANNWQKIDYHDHSPGRGVQISAPGIANGAVNSYHLAAPLAQDLGVNAAGTTGRGSLFHAGPGTRSSATSGALNDSADIITNLTVASNSLVMVVFHALAKASSGASGFADIVVDGTPITNGATTNGVAASTSASVSTTFYSPLYTVGTGLSTSTSSSGNASDASGGESVGTTGIFGLSAGQHSVGVQYGVTPGTSTITVQNRHLYVWTVNFI